MPAYRISAKNYEFPAAERRLPAGKWLMHSVPELWKKRLKIRLCHKLLVNCCNCPNRPLLDRCKIQRVVLAEAIEEPASSF
jgi:hypothetical protein